MVWAPSAFRIRPPAETSPVALRKLTLVAQRLPKTFQTREIPSDALARSVRVEVHCNRGEARELMVARLGLADCSEETVAPSATLFEQFAVHRTAVNRE